MAYYGTPRARQMPGMSSQQSAQLLPFLLALQQSQQSDRRADDRYGQNLNAVMQLAQQGQSGRDEARAANEERYNTILDRDLDTRNRLLDYLKGFGSSMEADINQNFSDNLNSSLASLSQSGLLGSTVRSSVEARNERERTDALRRLKDNLTQNAMGVDERASNRLSDFQERRTDAYPDDGQTNALIGQIMSAMGGSGGSTTNALQALMPMLQGALQGGSMSGPMGTQFASQNVPRSRGPSSIAGVARPTAPPPVLDRSRYDSPELQRQKAMQGSAAYLYDAMNRGGLEGEDRTRQALSYLTSIGYAQPTPNAGVPAVEPPQGYMYPTEGFYNPTGGFLTPDQRQSAIQNRRLASIARNQSRRTHVTNNRELRDVQQALRQYAPPAPDVPTIYDPRFIA